MEAIAIYILSLTFQIFAALFAIRLLKTNEHRLAWSLITGGLILMIVQRVSHLFPLLGGTPSVLPNLTDELVGMVISLLMVAGVTLLAPLLQTVKQKDQFREILNERNTLIQNSVEETLQALRGIHIALEVEKPPTLIMAQVSSLNHSLQTFKEEMKSGLLVGNNFVVALRSLIHDLSQGHPLPISMTLDTDMANHLTKEQGIHLLHIVREAIRNVQQHALAKKCRITLQAKQRMIVLKIGDNGKGFEVDLVEAQGHGLGNMVARAKKIDARLKIHSRPHHGTRIQVEVPINGTSGQQR